MKPLILLLSSLLLAFAAGASPRSPKVSTRRGTPAKSVRTAERKDAVSFDTIRFSSVTPHDSLLRLAGYDKPLRSRHETLHITNLSETLIILAVGLEIEYLDLQQRTLHSREAEVRATIPPLSTRLGRIPSWDVQQSFYFVGGQQPRTSNVTPYNVRLTPIYIVTDHR